MSENNRKKITKLMRIAVSLGLIIWLFSRFNLEGVWRALEGLPIALWIAACSMLLIAQVLSSFRWWVISSALDFQGKWSTYLGFYFVGMFFNLFLPTGIGGDIFKIHFLSKGIGRKLAATLTVLGDRLFGLVAMVMIGAFMALIRPALLPGPFGNALLIVGGFVILAILTMPVVMPATVSRLKGMNLSILKAVPGSVTQLGKPRTLWPILGLSFLLQALGMGAVMLMGEGMDIDVPPTFYFAVLPIVNIMIMIPITFNGIGIREGALVYFLGFRGIEPEPALALGLLVFSIQVVVSLVGGVVYALGFHRTAQLRSDQQPQ